MYCTSTMFRSESLMGCRFKQTKLQKAQQTLIIDGDPHANHVLSHVFHLPSKPSLLRSYRASDLLSLRKRELALKELKNNLHCQVKASVPVDIAKFLLRCQV